MGPIVSLSLILAATLTGSVRLPDGKAAESVLVAAVPHGGGWWSVAGVARTARDGSFRIDGLPPGAYALTATAASHGSAFIARANERQQVALRQGGRRLRGTVKHADGEPLHGRVLARRLSDHEHDLFVIETDGRGRFAARLPPARYRLYAEGADGRVEQTVDLRSRDASVSLRLERMFHVTPPAVVEWIRREAVPLTDPSLVRRLVGDARIVALGEATHGSREFFQIRFAILRFLVEEMGFRAVAIEADAAAPPAPWDSEELAEMVRWIEERRLPLYGIDMQDPSSIRASGLDAEWKRRLIEQGEQLLRVTARANELRDRFMAENVEWIVDRQPPGTKLVLLAHNGHVAAEGPQLLGGESMGHHLRQRYGDAIRIIGFAFDRGRFRAGTKEYEAPPARPASLDGALAAAGLPLFAIDFRGGRGVVRRWLESPVEQRFIGTAYDPAAPGDYWSTIHPGRAYDAMIFVRETTASRPVTADTSGTSSSSAR